MIRQNQTDSCLPCPNGTPKNPQSHTRCEDTDAPPPRPAQPQPDTPPAPPGDSEQNQCTAIEDVPPGYVYMNAPLPNTQFFNHDAYAQNRKRNKDCISDLVADQAPSTGSYAICCVVMQLISNWQMKAAF
jgi:hypothetical protein